MPCYRELAPTLLLTLSCLLFSVQAMAVTEFKIITLQYRFAEDILPAIQPLVGSEGAVTGMQNQLIIRTNPAKMAEIKQIIATLDVERKNLKITVRHQSSLQTNRDSATVSGRKRIGDMEIGTNPIKNRLPKNAKDGMQIDIDNIQGSTRSSSDQYINVLDGEHAFIRIGQSVPFTQEWVTLTRQYISVQKTTGFVDISTGFTVRPRSVGNAVNSIMELAITPRIAQLNAQLSHRGDLDFEELTMVVRVNRGEWLDLSGIMQQNDDVSRAILSKQSHDNQISIRVE